MMGQDLSVVTAKKAIADYCKAIGRPEGLAELSIVYCEQATRLTNNCVFDDEAYDTALVCMFDQALTRVMALALADRGMMVERLDAVRTSHRVGVSDAVNEIWQNRTLARQQSA